MLIPFKNIYDNYGLKITGILHVGAHDCEELKDYEEIISRDKILWIEAIPEKVESCKNKYENLLIENATVYDEIIDTEFKIANNGQSSSILNFGLHQQLYPHIIYTSSFNVKTKLLSDIISHYNIKFNFINLDIQGTELNALKGMKDYLVNIDYIYSEVNSNYVYQNCALVNELDDFLGQYGFKRIQTEWVNGCSWGDAFYIKQK